MAHHAAGAIVLAIAMTMARVHESLHGVWCVCAKIANGGKVEKFDVHVHVFLVNSYLEHVHVVSQVNVRLGKLICAK